MTVWLVFEACEVGVNGEENCSGAAVTVCVSAARAKEARRTRADPRRGVSVTRLLACEDE